MKLKDYRKLMGLNQKQAAKQLETSQPTINRWEQGLMLPSIKSAVKIIDWSNGQITADDLFGFESRLRERLKARMKEDQEAAK